MEWLGDELRVDGAERSAVANLMCFWPATLVSSAYRESSKLFLAQAGLGLTGGDMRITGVPVGTEDHQMRCFGEIVNGGALELTRAPAQRKAPQACSRTIRPPEQRG